MTIQEKYMHRCIQLAKNGLGLTYPNPLVGSVIVLDDKIIGEGWHQKAGKAHAEVNAVHSVKNKELLRKATIYINLEPCSHYGKTPPCSNFIIESGIKNVVIGNLDPNPKVAGKGIKKLKEAGCMVRTGVLKNECAELNKRFFTFYKKKRPYIILKWAQTLDGFIAPNPTDRNEQKPVWITNSYSRQFVHKLRAKEMSILVGTTTVLQDNPTLTTRDWAGENPVRLVIDRELKLPHHFSVFNQSAPTIVFTEREKDTVGKTTYEKIDFTNLPSEICRILYKHSLQSVIIEGGSQTIQSFIDENLWDDAYVFIGKKIFHKGISAPHVKGVLLGEKHIVNDELFIYRNIKN